MPLFGNVDYSTNITSPKNIEVKEFKAPTDDSLKLLKEYQEKALEAVIEMIPVKNNDIEFTICRMSEHFEDYFIVKVSINGVIHSTKIGSGCKDLPMLVSEICEWFGGLFFSGFLEETIFRNRLYL